MDSVTQSLFVAGTAPIPKIQTGYGKNLPTSPIPAITEEKAGRATNLKMMAPAQSESDLRTRKVDFKMAATKSDYSGLMADNAFKTQPKVVMN